MPSNNDLDEILRLQGAMVQYPFEATGPKDWRDGAGGTAWQHVVNVWNRRRVLIISLFLIIMAVACARVLTTPRTYESVLKLFVKRPQIESLLSDKNAAAEGAGESSESEVRSEMEILRSRDLLEKVVLRCRLAAESGNDAGVRRRLAAAVQKLEKDLLISPVAKTNIIAVKYASPNPNQSAEVLKVLAALYIEKHTAMHRSHETSQFFSAQANRYHADLIEAQQKLSDFEQHYGASLLEERKDLTLKRRGEIEAAIQQLDAQAEDARNAIKVLNSQKAALPATIQIQSRTARNEGLVGQLKAVLLDLQNKRVQLATKFEPGYRLVVEVDEQIRQTKEAIQRESAPVIVDQTNALNPLRQSVELELSQAQSRMAGLLAQRASLTRDLERSRAQEDTYGQVTAEYNDLQRQKAIAESNYLLYQKRTEEAQIADELDQHKFLNVSILEEPVVPVLPVSRHSAFVLLLGFTFATLSSFGVAFAMESFDPLIRTPYELMVRTGLPVLASVSVSHVIARATDERQVGSGLGADSAPRVGIN
jgi:uncharacterized protein involved in exopolysaccharide biosynthesis